MCGRIKCDCTLNGIPLWGDYRVVTNFADFDVQKDASFPDLKVLETNFPDSCGEWREVTIGEDFTVKWVTSFPDFSIQFSSFPGIP
jgi:hypothetical protein